MKTALEKIAERIKEEKDKVEAKYSPQVRNHLLQLFVKAKKKDKKLESIETICGEVYLHGGFKNMDGDFDNDIYEFCFRTWFEDRKPKYQETRDLFDALLEYEGELCNGLPYIETIK